MVDNNDTLFREVKDEIRREQFVKLWERYGTYILLGAAAVVAAIVGYQLWEARRASNASEAGAAFEAANVLLKSDKPEDAAKAFGELVESGPKGYASLAALSQAGAYLKLDKRAEALAVFDKLAGDASADPLLSNYARLQAASLRLGDADFTEMQNRLTPLIADDSPWRFTARELLGTAALQAGNLDEARKTLGPLLADGGLGQGASERVHRLMAKIATAELSTPEKAAPEAAPAPSAPEAGAKPEVDKPASVP